jgi:hypothetical protein
VSTSVALIDTSVLCEVVDVPGKSGETELYRALLEEKVAEDESLLLPVTAILETGNHIGQCSADGGRRRKAAEGFVELVISAIKGAVPFRPTPFFEPEAMLNWLAEFPNWVSRSDAKGKGSGFGDLSIQKEWERQCKLNPGRRVYIWSKDQHLQSYDKPPQL